MNRRLCSILCCTAFLTALPVSPAQSPVHSLQREVAFSGIGAWHLAFQVDANNDLAGSIETWDALGDGFGVPGTYESSFLLAVLKDRHVWSYHYSVGAGGIPVTAYATANGYGMETGPLLSDEGTGGGLGGWTHIGLTGGNAMKTIEIIFLSASPQANIWINATWTRGVQVLGDNFLPHNSAIAWRPSEFPEGINAGTKPGVSASIALHGVVDAPEGLVGAFRMPKVNDVDLALGSCSSPSNASTCYVGEDKEFLFGTEPGDWVFHIDGDLRPLDDRKHVLLAVVLPPPP